MSRQMEGSRLRLAATSIMNIGGMISAGGMTSDSDVIASSENRNPLYPRTNAAANTQTAK